jgi:proteasome lid subunit RPN8/RPN11
MKMKSRLTQPSNSHRLSPSLRFSPTAWAKLLFLRDRGMSEVGGFGIARPDDLLYVEDIQTVEQQCSVVTVKFDDTAVARFFDQQVDAGRQPAQFARIWIHTHPEMSAQPSGTDEQTFARVFENTDWAVMFILSKTDDVYCRLRFNVGPSGAWEIPVSVDYRGAFAGSDVAAWEAEYTAHVRTDVGRLRTGWPDGARLDVVKLRPGQAHAAISERIARAGRILAAQGWTQEALAEAVLSGNFTLEQLVELAEHADENPALASDAELRKCLERQWGWSQEDIDEQLQLGWTLAELLDWCECGDDFDSCQSPVEELHELALFPIEP